MLLLVIFSTHQPEISLGLRFRWLEWAGEDTDLGILDLFGHLRMGHLLVNEKTFNELSLLNGRSSHTSQLDEFEVDILTFQISDLENSIHSNSG